MDLIIKVKILNPLISLKRFSKVALKDTKPLHPDVKKMHVKWRKMYYFVSWIWVFSLLPFGTVVFFQYFTTYHLPDEVYDNIVLIYMLIYFIYFLTFIFAQYAQEVKEGKDTLKLKKRFKNKS